MLIISSFSLRPCYKDLGRLPRLWHVFLQETSQVVVINDVDLEYYPAYFWNGELLMFTE